MHLTSALSFLLWTSIATVLISFVDIWFALNSPTTFPTKPFTCPDLYKELQFVQVPSTLWFVLDGTTADMAYAPPTELSLLQELLRTPERSSVHHQAASPIPLLRARRNAGNTLALHIHAVLTGAQKANNPFTPWRFLTKHYPTLIHSLRQTPTTESGGEVVLAGPSAWCLGLDNWSQQVTTTQAWWFSPFLNLFHPWRSDTETNDEQRASFLSHLLSTFSPIRFGVFHTTALYSLRLNHSDSSPLLTPSDFELNESLKELASHVYPLVSTLIEQIEAGERERTMLLTFSLRGATHAYPREQMALYQKSHILLSTTPKTSLLNHHLSVLGTYVLKEAHDNVLTQILYIRYGERCRSRLRCDMSRDFDTMEDTVGLVNTFSNELTPTTAFLTGSPIPVFNQAAATAEVLLQAMATHPNMCKDALQSLHENTSGGSMDDLRTKDDDVTIAAVQECTREFERILHSVLLCNARQLQSTSPENLSVLSLSELYQWLLETQDDSPPLLPTLHLLHHPSLHWWPVLAVGLLSLLLLSSLTQIRHLIWPVDSPSLRSSPGSLFLHSVNLLGIALCCAFFELVQALNSLGNIIVILLILLLSPAMHVDLGTPLLRPVPTLAVFLSAFFNNFETPKTVKPNRVDDEPIDWIGFVLHLLLPLIALVWFFVQTFPQSSSVRQSLWSCRLAMVSLLCLLLPMIYIVLDQVNILTFYHRGYVVMSHSYLGNTLLMMLYQRFLNPFLPTTWWLTTRKVMNDWFDQTFTTAGLGILTFLLFGAFAWLRWFRSPWCKGKRHSASSSLTTTVCTWCSTKIGLDLSIFFSSGWSLLLLCGWLSTWGMPISSAIPRLFTLVFIQTMAPLYKQLLQQKPNTHDDDQRISPRRVTAVYIASFFILFHSILQACETPLDNRTDIWFDFGPSYFANAPKMVRPILAFAWRAMDSAWSNIAFGLTALWLDSTCRESLQKQRWMVSTSLLLLSISTLATHLLIFVMRLSVPLKQAEGILCKGVDGLIMVTVMWLVKKILT